MGGKFGLFSGPEAGAWGLFGAFLTPRRPKNRFSAIGTRFWADLGKSIFRPFLAHFDHPYPLVCPVWDLKLTEKLENWSKMVFFDVSEAGKPVLLPPGAQTPEVVAYWPRIVDFRSFLVHFGQILGDLGMDFGQFQSLRRGHGGSLGLF